ncbi:MAG: pyridoxal phosphate-dependent aminotransferase [bacterium]|nr:pyridoxal phosphate-dependent aminotransferase [bacterium]
MQISQRVAALAESATLAISARAAALRRQGQDVISFGAGEPDFDTPEPIKAVAIEAIRAGQTKYPKPASGLPQAKEAVRTKLARENGLEHGLDQVIVTAGGKMACQLACMATLNPGDEVIIPVPYWVSYPELVKLAEATPVFVRGREEDNFCLQPKQLAAALTDRTRAMFLNSPSNPGGSTYTPDQIRALAEVLAGREVWVYSDEIYDRLLFEGREFLSYAAVGPEAYAQAITINGASKTYSMTGWRVAYAAGPAPVIKAMAKLQSQGTSGAATFTQLALAAALTDSQESVEQMRVEYERRAGHIHRRLNDLPGVSCTKPTGAFYAFPNVSRAFERLKVSGSAEFCERVLNEAQVAIVPGVAFGSDEHARFSFACSLEQIDAGLDRLAKLLG